MSVARLDPASGRDAAPGEIPTPVHTAKITVTVPGGDDVVLVRRIWTAEDAANCQLCPVGECVAKRCDFAVKAKGEPSGRAYICTVVADRPIDGSAALFSLLR